MKINKKLELTFTNSSTYILEPIADNFFINKGDQQILLLDKNINTAETIELNLPVSIYSSLYSDDGEKIVLYCPDDNLLIYCDIINKKAISINIEDLETATLSSVYYYDKNKFLISAYDKGFYIFDCVTHKIEPAALDYVKENYTIFYNFWLTVKQHGFGYQINSQQQTFIYKEESSNQVIYFDYKNDKKTIVQDPETGYHDIIFHQGYFIFIAEEELTIIKNNDIYRYPIEDPLYAFLRARFTTEDGKLFIIVLSTNECKYTTSKIAKYELSCNHQINR